jgi:hypothetical protein
MDQHITVYDDIINDIFCRQLIETFNQNTKSIQHFPGWMDQIGMCETKPKLPGMPKPYAWQKEVDQLNSVVLPLIESYVAELDVFKILPKNWDQEAYRIKRYRKDEQEFRIHADCSTVTNSSRFLAVLIYLNDNDAGTEFPCQNIYVEAKQGRVVVFPPAWPWPHRGLRPRDSDKYIISTYFCYPIK